MRNIVFELCAETIDACIAARDGGADRIELCSGLSEGGLTPSHGLVRAAVDRAGLPIHTLIRPRGGDFLYSGTETAIMADDIVHMKELGVAGVVLGLLNSDGTVDGDRTRSLVQLARPMRVTFHRAFDATRSLPDALEAIIELGCDRVLTSGGERDVIAGTACLSALVEQAAGRIQVAAGGGLRLQNAASLARLTGATHFHGSLRRRVAAAKPGIATDDRSAEAGATDGGATDGGATDGGATDGGAGFSARSHRYVVDADAIRAVISRLQRA